MHGKTATAGAQDRRSSTVLFTSLSNLQTGAQVVLEMDEESEEEVEVLSDMYDQRDGEGTHRFQLLRELWASAR